MGRPSKYREEFAGQATKFCKLGATDAELAEFFEVEVSTIDNWKKQYPEFLGALKAGKAIADIEVAEKLHSRATGYSWVEEQAIKVKTGRYEEKVEVVEVRREVPPDTTACIFWLKNRRRQHWRGKQDHELTGKDEGPVQTENAVRDYSHLMISAQMRSRLSRPDLDARLAKETDERAD